MGNRQSAENRTKLQGGSAVIGADAKNPQSVSFTGRLRSPVGSRMRTFSFWFSEFGSLVRLPDKVSLQGVAPWTKLSLGLTLPGSFLAFDSLAPQDESRGYTP